MTREELKKHCLKQVEACEMWARHNGEKPHGKVYEEHKLILELLEQEPFINKPCISEGVCREDKIQVLDKIRAEIEQSPVKTITNWNGCCPDFDCPEIEYITKNEMLNIIDKYKRESEDKE